MKVAYKSITGKLRENNEDYVGVFTNNKNIKLGLLADGIGGNRGGEVASKMAVLNMGEKFEHTDFDDYDSAYLWLKSQISFSNVQILNTSKRFDSLKNMGTTVVATIVFDDRFLITNLGDSRGYLMHGNKFMQLTEDHSYVNELVKSGELSPKEALNSPLKNVIVKSLGISDDSDVKIRDFPFNLKDQILICSDGLTNMLSDKEIKRQLSLNNDVETKCVDLVELANANGGTDNISVLIIKNDKGRLPDA
ncbi:Stp1/IreP family PP2C-type Ser/Thr phosphatase [Apilactobacillus xinyiensis]|uniref:Stp1/IreP family PP2C-type Ser/Thr phosphatase n=1 Tax=Apilactobacillus xinyiensis TaxID=2841032 RepID=A0ABT0I010_9LACO|nr:Stp1/IreP family PP2C-type Ser/Thr phosphatase [Apilactobacillus xinyiensis]MCK8624165.1 Stp1/IreP family PP2C-type Ser/Thr phosphatase [Apilactobacillus xinyiensis]MCL0318383.1 Stp1/IreP family PP2C-type Ser/Thr phosphatase [Apilactobacillus xinyiensis]